MARERTRVVRRRPRRHSRRTARRDGSRESRRAVRDGRGGPRGRRARVWRENSETASLEQVFESSGAHGAPAVSAAWWSPGKLAVSFEDGAVIVADVDAFLKRRPENAPPENDFPETNGNVLGSAPERFEASRERAGVLLAACPMPAASANGTSDPVCPGAETARVAVLEFPEVAEVAEVTGDEPRPVRPTGSSQIRWRVATIGSRTPRQALERALEREDWEGAEALCVAHPATLDLDDARKRRFLRTPPGARAARWTGSGATYATAPGRSWPPPRSSATRTRRSASRSRRRCARRSGGSRRTPRTPPPLERRNRRILETRRVRVPHRGTRTNEIAWPWKIGKLVLVAPAPPGGPRAFGPTRRVARLEAGRVQRGGVAAYERAVRGRRREESGVARRRARRRRRRARVPPRRRRGRCASAHPGNVFGDHFRRRVRAASALARALERAGVSSASFQRGCCVVDPKPSRVQNRRAQVRERARRRFRRVARRRRGAPARTRRRRGVRFVRAGARRARERGRARARREPRRHAERDVAVAFDRARPRRRRGGGRGARRRRREGIFLAPGHLGRARRGRGVGAPPRVAVRRRRRRLRHGRGAARGRGKPRARRRN